jgi:lipopolysaccharide export system permease protein
LIIQRYLIREVWQASLAVLIVLVIIFTSHRFVRYLGDVAAGVLPPDVITTLVALKVVNFLPWIVPLALYLGTLIALGRWHRDGETIALASVGVSPQYLGRVVTALGLFTAFGVALLAFYVAPWAAGEGYDIKVRAERLADFSAIASGRFVESKTGDWVFYAERYLEKQKRLFNVFVQARQDKGIDVFAAERAVLRTDPETGDKLVTMYNGYRYFGAPGQEDFRILKYAEQTVRLRSLETEPVFHKRDATPTAALLDATEARDIAELQWRISMPLSSVLLALMAASLSATAGRQRRFTNVTVAVLIYIMYSNLLGVARTWLQRGDVPPLVGMWWVHLMLLALAVALAFSKGALRRLSARAATEEDRPA